MFTKTLTLNLLPYIVCVASSLLAAQQLMPSLGLASAFQSSGSPKGSIVSNQAVNRSLKSNRLPIMETIGGAEKSINEPAHIRYAKFKNLVMQNLKIKFDCRPRFDVPGRCFADARLYHKMV